MDLYLDTQVSRLEFNETRQDAMGEIKNYVEELLLATAKAETQLEDLKYGVKDFLASHKDEASVPLGDILQFATEWGIEVFQEYRAEITTTTVFTIQAEIGQEPSEFDFDAKVEYIGNYDVGSSTSYISKFEVYPRN